MKKIIVQPLFIALTLSVLVSCKPKLTEPSASKGSLDVSRYVSVGNSITSGFADAALYYDGQMVSYPNLLAMQFKLIGGGDFKQPYVPVGSVGIGSSVNSRLILGYKTDCLNVGGLSPVNLASSGDLSIFSTNISSQGPFNNMGVPGAKVVTAVVPGYGLFNPFFGRMVPSANLTSASMISQAVAQNPTFFSFFLGNNDVLGYATSGGTSDYISPSSGPMAVGFDASVDTLIGRLTRNGAKGIIGSVPDVTSLPYFTTIPYNGLLLTSSQAALLNGYYAQMGLTFVAGNNPFVIKDSTFPGGVRKIRSDELVLITTPQDSLKCGSWGATKPLANAYVLTEPEISKIQTAVIAYNGKLRSVASAKGLAFVDVNAFMSTVKAGITYNGIAASTTFVSGGAFSLDGIHLTPFGNAMLANQFIIAINATYGSSIPQIDATKYHGVVFP